MYVKQFHLGNPNPYQRYYELAEKWQDGTITPGELQELENWFNQDQDKPVQIPASFVDDEQEHARRILAGIRTKITGRKPVKRMRWYAAAIMLLLGLGLYFYYVQTPEKPHPQVTDIKPDDIPPPANNRATILLADGSRVFLDSAGNGQLAQQGNIKLVKLANGQIAYQLAGGQILQELQYNTLTNPRGSKVINMQLSDGSHVWLNAGSSVTYPVAFTGNERKVNITGEAYFEIVHNKSQPFKVSKGNMAVEVLGTHFNVNAYDDETDIKVTLLEGSVKVINGTGSRQIQPGQQAQLNNHGNPQIPNNLPRHGGIGVQTADVDQVMAWKNGRFYFDGADITTIMKEVKRWYNVEVVFNDVVNYDFVAKIDRDVPVSELLNMLELTGGVHFKVQENKIIVSK